MSRHHRIPFLVATAIASLSFSSARAQIAPGGQQPINPRGEDNLGDEGVAEQAPKELGVLPTTPTLPPATESRKELRVFSLDGYLRLRTDWMKKFDLGFTDLESLGGAPFSNALGCRNSSNDGGCKTSLSSANMRLRLEPTVHLDERARVHMQIDVLDNIALGSSGLAKAEEDGSRNMPLGDVENNQHPGEDLGLGDSIVVKRAWAEIDAPLGILTFGRQPWDWGMGILANGGGSDPVHGGYNLDADSGDTVDRLSLSATIPGTSLQGSLSIDWAQMGPTARQIGEQRGPGRQTWDMDDADDLDQWVFALSHIDTPTQIADRLADGEYVLNYGVFGAYRTQSWEQRNVTLGESPNPEDFVRRGMTVYVPDVWAHFAVGKLDIEAEAVAVIGSAQAPELGIEKVSMRQYGGVARLAYKLLDDDLTFRFEAGFASGDQWDNEVPGRTHKSGAVGLGPNDNTLKQFFFDENYHVDLILFRELLGAVTNAFYGKTSFQYDLNKKFTIRGATILSGAHRPVATPGNSELYGLEFDADLGYENEGFFAGFSYGIFLPFGAMDHPQDEAFGFGINNGSADTAQTIQTRFVLQF